MTRCRFQRPLLPKKAVAHTHGRPEEVDRASSSAEEAPRSGKRMLIKFQLRMTLAGGVIQPERLPVASRTGATWLTD